MTVSFKMPTWNTTDADDPRLDPAIVAMQRANAAQHRAAHAAALAASAAYQAEAARLYGEFDQAAGLTDPEAERVAIATLEAAKTLAANIAAELTRQRTALAKLEAKSVDVLESASLDELKRIAAGRSAAADELRSTTLVVEELQRRHQLAQDAIATAESRLGAVRTSGLSALADELAQDAITLADQLSAQLRRLGRLQTLVSQRGGATFGRIAMSERLAADLERTSAIYHNRPI